MMRGLDNKIGAAHFHAASTGLLQFGCGAPSRYWTPAISVEPATSR